MVYLVAHYLPGTMLTRRITRGYACFVKKDLILMLSEICSDLTSYRKRKILPRVIFPGMKKTFPTLKKEEDEIKQV